MLGLGIDIFKNKNLGGAPSSITLNSSGSTSSPLVGDVLYIESTYISTTASLQDYASTTYTFKRDGVDITTSSYASQYILTSTDVGTIISVTVQIVEQSGAIQILSDSLSGAVSGSGWCLGDLQTTYEGLWDMTDLSYPKLQLFDETDGIEIARVKCLLGNGIDFKPEQSGHNFKWDSTNVGVGNYVTTRGSLYKPLTDFDATEGTMFFKFYIPNSLSGSTYFLQYFGASNESCLYDPLSSRYRVELAGVRADFSAQPGDTVVAILRWSDVAFTTLNAVTNRKTEVYVWSTYGGSPKYSYANNLSNVLTGATPDWGHAASTTEFKPSYFTFHYMGWCNTKATDSEMTTIMEGLKAL